MPLEGGKRTFHHRYDAGAAGADAGERPAFCRVCFVDLLEAAVLSQLLMSRVARRTLLGQPTSPGAGADQRREASPEVLARRVRDRQAALGRELETALEHAERLLTMGKDQGLSAIPFGGAGYPTRLESIPDPPPLLWYRGRRGLLDTPSVALVGSRAGSSYACEVAEHLGFELSDLGVTVVSGLARGVDGAAHRGGLKGSASTVAVLGCGVDVVYPPEHRGLASEIATIGTLLSEVGPSVPPLGLHFPRRNRIISGLAAAVVIIEASTRSGSLITARCAADQGREVMAVPGNVLTGRNRGGHALIKDGAKIVETVDDILEEISLGVRPSVSVRPVVEEEPDLLLQHMDTGESYDLDTLGSVTGLDSPRLLARLVDLELEGRICRSPTGRFRRLPR